MLGDWQYDLSVTTFSPDGRVFQIEYATKAVDNSGYDYICLLGLGVMTETIVNIVKFAIM
jgi:hypothetical protein